MNQKGFHVATHESCTVPGQGNYWDYLILGRVLRPHQGDTVSPRRGLNDTGDILDVRKDVAADSQHKTRNHKKCVG